MAKKVGVIGLGYWGPKLARCFNQLGALHAIADQNEERLFSVSKDLKVTNLASDITALCSMDIDAVAISTPPETHEEIAVAALKAGKDVFIEKPMTTSLNAAKSVEKLAKTLGRNLMVGHIYLHNPGIQRMPIPVGTASLYVQLLNEGRGPSESTRDVVWAGLPHAVSLALHFFPDEPDDIIVQRSKDRIKVLLTYFNGSEAYLDVGDFTGRKLRKVELRIQDSRYLFDVAQPEGVTLLSGTEVTSFGFGDMGKRVESLMEECKAFLEYKGVDPLGSKVVELIEEIMHASKS